MAQNITQKFDVALSFAGEDRDYVEKVASILREMEIRVFYDKYESVTLWGKDLYVHLGKVYSEMAGYTVMFISENYGAKLWTNRERESAQARAFAEHREYILPVRFDDTEIPGLLSTIGYVDARVISPKELAEMIKEKVGPILRVEFFPENPDLLYSYLNIADPADKEEVYDFAEYFFQCLKLMTPQERHLLAAIVRRTFPLGPPENVHVNLALLERFLSLSRDEIISMFSRLDCLKFRSRIDESYTHGKDTLTCSRDIIQVSWEPRLLGYPHRRNSTDILIAIFDCIFNCLCGDCANEALERIDLSILGTYTGFSEK